MMITREQLSKWLEGEALDADDLHRIEEAIRNNDARIQKWLDEFQEELSLGSEEVLPDMAQAEKDLLHKLNRSRIFTISTANTTPGEWFRGSAEGSAPISGTLRGYVGTELRDFAVEMRKTAGGPPIVELQISRWPMDAEPICLILAELDIFQRKPVTQHTDLAMAPLAWAAESGDRLPEENDLELQVAPDLTVDVWGKVPEGRSSEHVVAECRIEDAAGNQSRQIQLVELRLGSPGGKRRGRVHFAPPEERSGTSACVTVRSLTEEDFWLLDTVAATDRLARTKRLLTMPSVPTEKGFAFSARWRDQQQMAGDPTASWFLSVAQPR